MLRAGVIGLGVMGKHHARIYSEMAGIELVGVADSNEQLASDIARACSTGSFTDYGALLARGLDVVSIALPTFLHRDATVAAAKAGAHVLVEKPIADTLQHAADMTDICQKNSVKLMVGHVERFNPAVPVVKARIRGAEVLLMSFTRVGPFPSRIKDVGVIVDLATHDIDLARYLVDSTFKRVHSLASGSGLDGGNREDCALMSFEMENGTLVQIMVNWLTPFKVREFSVATRERYTRAWLRDQKVVEYESWEDDSYVVREVPVRYAEPLRLELEAFVAAVINDTPVPVSGEDGLEALSVALHCAKAIGDREE